VSPRRLTLLAINGRSSTDAGISSDVRLIISANFRFLAAISLLRGVGANVAGGATVGRLFTPPLERHPLIDCPLGWSFWRRTLESSADMPAGCVVT
jgi:hypothetical protein